MTETTQLCTNNAAHMRGPTASTWWRRRRVVASYRPAARPAVIEKAAESRVVYFLPIYVFISTTTPRLRDTPLKTTKLKISHHGVGWRLVHGANQIVAANRANKRRVFGPRLGGRRNQCAARMGQTRTEATFTHIADLQHKQSAVTPATAVLS